ncbi:MAG: flagellum-specific ATP synthase FliI, partial [Lachnospiraceae bacterium]|nr:flagellum-specific ATP synthase FliI [Lachnospiraceae bacterium]
MAELEAKLNSLLNNNYFDCLGKVTKVVGLTIESMGPEAKLNDVCHIKIDDENYVSAEVVGFADNRLLLMPFENVEGISVGAIVENTNRPLEIPVGDELLGHTVDGLGRPT